MACRSMQAEPNDPNAMALATVDADGMPDVRMVLMKGYDADGFVFYSHIDSAKGPRTRRKSEGGAAVSLEIAAPAGPHSRHA